MPFSWVNMRALFNCMFGVLVGRLSSFFKTGQLSLLTFCIFVAPHWVHKETTQPMVSVAQASILQWLGYGCHTSGISYISVECFAQKPAALEM